MKAAKMFGKVAKPVNSQKKVKLPKGSSPVRPDNKHTNKDTGQFGGDKARTQASHKVHPPKMGR